MVKSIKKTTKKDVFIDLIEASFEKITYRRKESFDMTTDKNVFENEEQAQEEFEKNNSFYMSESELFHKYELKFQQTVALSEADKRHPNRILTFLNKIEHLGLLLASPESASFFTEPKGMSFDECIKTTYPNVIGQATLKMYVYLVLLRRRGIEYHFNDHVFTFDIRDVKDYGGIEYKMFDTITDINSDIVRRMGIKVDTMKGYVKKYEKQWIKLETKIKFYQTQLTNLSPDANTSEEALKNKANEYERQIKHTEQAMNDLADDVYETLTKTLMLESVTTSHVNHFIAHFLAYGIQIDAQEFERHKDDITLDHGVYTTHHRKLIKHMNEDDIYVQHPDLIWLPAKASYEQLVSIVAPKSRFTQKQLEHGFSRLTDQLKLSHDANIFTFRHHAIFFKNGILLLEYDDTGKIQYQFKNHDDMTRREIMFQYATHYRLDMVYNPKPQTIFDDNEVSEPVTPDYIFGALGRRGYEHDEAEASERSNLLMQYALKILLPYDDLYDVEGTFLYFYNASNSGKSTFMRLMENMAGIDKTANLETKDFSKKESFGLSTIKDKRLILIDEATDGQHKIETENIKKISTKERITANVKNNPYMKFTPNAEMIFASNYEPMFHDESGGTEKRLLAFQLENGYDNTQEGFKDLRFIRYDLINRSEFQSACIQWILDHVNVKQDIPQSVKSDSLEIISSEDDVQSFIKSRIRQSIEEPLFINIDHLYDLYRLESLAKGRKTNNIRNKSNFKKALMKMRHGVYNIKQLDHSSVDVMNRLLWLHGKLFEDYSNQLNNNELSNNIILTFKTMSQERANKLDKFYNHVVKMANKEMYISNVGRSKSTLIAILPDNDIYNTTVSDEDLIKISKNQKRHFLESVLKLDRNVNLILNGDYKKLPSVINAYTSDNFLNYSTTNLDKKTIL